MKITFVGPKTTAEEQEYTCPIYTGSLVESYYVTVFSSVHEFYFAWHVKPLSQSEWL